MSRRPELKNAWFGSKERGNAGGVSAMRMSGASGLGSESGDEGGITSREEGIGEAVKSNAVMPSGDPGGGPAGIASPAEPLAT